MMFRNLIQCIPQRFRRKLVWGLGIGLALIPLKYAYPTVFGLKSTDLNGTPNNPITNPLFTHLFSFEEDLVGGVTDIGAVTLGGAQINGDALAIDKLNNLFAFQLSGNNSQLISINKTNATATAVGSVLTGRDIRGAVFDFDNRLLAIDSLNNQVLKINPNTGGILGSLNLTLGNNPFDISNATDIAIRLDGIDNKTISKTIFVNDRSNFYTLDINTGQLTLAYSDNLAIPVGIALSESPKTTPSELFAFDVANRGGTDADDLFKFETNNNFNRTTLAQNILPEFNSGRGDLAAVVQAEIPEPSSVGAILILGSGFLWRSWRKKDQ